jgi:hypothetical protein
MKTSLNQAEDFPPVGFHGTGGTVWRLSLH